MRGPAVWLLCERLCVAEMTAGGALLGTDNNGNNSDDDDGGDAII